MHLDEQLKTVARYKTMAGYKVLRKAGWDTHGLPVELGVESNLVFLVNMIEEYGIEPFIQKCKRVFHMRSSGVNSLKVLVMGRYG